MHEILDNYCVYNRRSEIGGVPWHRIGTGLEVVTADDVLKYAAFDRQIGSLPITLDVIDAISTPENAENLAKSIDGYRATVDLKHGRVLGVVSDKFTLVQPRELLSAAEFLCNEMGAVISCAATIRDGKREFISLAMPEDSIMEARDGDLVKRFFNLAQGHDGSLAACVGSSAIRAVCANTLAAFLAEGNAIKMRHSQGIHAALARAVAVFRVGRAEQEAFYQKLAGKTVNPEEVISYYTTLTETDSLEAMSKATKNSFAGKLVALLDDPARCRGIQWSNPGIPATAWDVYNVATQVINHESTTKDPLNSILWGAGHKHLRRAEQLASGMFLGEAHGAV